MEKIRRSIKNINWKLFIALLVMGLCPTIWTTVRTNFIGQLPGEWSYSIAGQLTWVNLIYEIINEAIILPLFFFIGKVLDNKDEFINRIKTGLVISLIIYSILSVIILIFSEKLLFLMAANVEIIEESASYIRVESIANIFGILYSFTCVALVSLGKDKYVYILTFVKLILSLLFDTLFVSTLEISFNLGVNGIGYSNILTNMILFLIIVGILYKSGYNIFNKKRMEFFWAKDFLKVGGISGLESFVRNIAYMLMVSRMVNMVGEQGVYWVANNFIWGYMLLPITELGELIKQETSTNREAVKNNTIGYFTITIITCIIWTILIPLYRPFMGQILGYNDVDKLFNLVMVLFIFYVLYAIQNVFDSTFYGLGKTNYMLFESVVTNSIYYGTFYILYLTNIWTPTLLGIALMFGIGNLFDSVVSLLAYRYFLKKNNINIFDVC